MTTRLLYYINPKVTGFNWWVQFMFHICVSVIGSSKCLINEKRLIGHYCKQDERPTKPVVNDLMEDSDSDNLSELKVLTRNISDWRPSQGPPQKAQWWWWWWWWLWQVSVCNSVISRGIWNKYLKQLVRTVSHVSVFLCVFGFRFSLKFFNSVSAELRKLFHHFFKFDGKPLY